MKHPVYMICISIIIKNEIRESNALDLHKKGSLQSSCFQLQLPVDLDNLLHSDVNTVFHPPGLAAHIALYRLKHTLYI